MAEFVYPYTSMILNTAMKLANILLGRRNCIEICNSTSMTEESEKRYYVCDAPRGTKLWIVANALLQYQF